MKLHLNLSLRRALLAAMAAVATFATSATAGVMHSDATYQTYTDFGQNCGRYVVGTKVNALLSHIRTEEGGITINYTDGSESFLISNEQGMISFNGTHDSGHSAVIAPTFIATVLHNGSLDGSFSTRTVGSSYAINYEAIDIRGSKNFRLAPEWGTGQYDYMLQRQSKVVTDVTWNQLTTLSNDEIESLDGGYIYHSGSGTMYLWDEENERMIYKAGPYTFVIGAINGIVNGQVHADGENISIHQNPNYVPNDGASVVNPLPNGARPGDSGSPTFIYNSATGQYEYIAAQQSAGAEAYGQARGNVEWTQETLNKFDVNIDMSGGSEIHLGAVDTAGETITETVGSVTYSTTLYSGSATDSAGNKVGDYVGVKSDVNTWANLDDRKNLNNWYAYQKTDTGWNSPTYGQVISDVLVSDADLFYTQNLVFSSSQATNDIILDASVDLGIGYAEFNKVGEVAKAVFNITADTAGIMFNHAGYVVNEGTEVHLKLTNSNTYMTEWRKIGAGDLYIDGTGNTNALLNVGGSGKTYLNQTGGHAAYNVLVNSGATVVINGINQIERDLTFGAGGGTLDMNGNSMYWYTSGGESRDGFTIQALTEEAMITNASKTQSSLTYMQGGDTTYKGSFADTATGALSVVYSGGGTWTLNSIHTDLSHWSNSGLTVANGKVILCGTNTVHGLGSATATNVNRLSLNNDWHYADARMNVTVANGATFELGSHARLTGAVNLNDGGTFIIREAVKHQYEYVEGGAELEDTYRYADYYGYKGGDSTGISLGGANSALKIEYSEGTTANTTIAASISGNGSVSVDTGLAGGTLTLSGTNTMSGTKTLISGGLIAESADALGDTSTNKWNVQEQGWIVSHSHTGAELLTKIDSSSTGVLALSSDTNEQLTLSGHTSLYVGAEIGKTIEYGEIGTTTELAAQDGAWRLGGGGGTLNVNFLLAGKNNLIIGNEYSSGTVHLANTGNTFSGDIIIMGTGNLLTYAATSALGSAHVALTYGNTLAMHQLSDLLLLKTGAQGVMAAAGSFDVDLTGYDVALGAAGDVTFTNTITVGDMYWFGGSGNLILDTTLDSSKDILIDGQGNSGSSVTFAQENAYSGNIVAGGGMYLETPNSAGSVGIYAEHANAFASTNSVVLQQGAVLYTDGHANMVVQNLTAQTGSSISNNGTTASSLELRVTENSSIADGVLNDANNANPLSLVKTGEGNLSMAGNKSWSGGLTIQEGQVTVYAGNGGVGSSANRIQIDGSGTLRVEAGKVSYGDIGQTIVNQTITGTGTIVAASGGNMLLTQQAAGFEGTVHVTEGTRLYVGKDLTYSNRSATSYNNVQAFDNATIKVDAGSQVRITNNFVHVSQASVVSHADYIISGSGMSAATSTALVHERLIEGALSIDCGATLTGNVTLAEDATIASWSHNPTATLYRPTLQNIYGRYYSIDNGTPELSAHYGIKGYLGGTIRGQILGEGKDLTIGGNESMTFSADSANTFGNLNIANGNGSNTDQFALRLDGGKDVSQTSTALGLGQVTLNDGLILRLAGTGTANQTDVVYTYANNINAGNGAMLQSYNITNKLTGTVTAAGDLNLATANGGVLHLAGGVAGSGALNLAAGSQVILGSANGASFSGNIVAGAGAALTLESSAAVASTTSITGTDSFSLNLSGTSDYTLGGIALGTSEGVASSSLTLSFDFTNPTAEDTTTLYSSISAGTTTIALNLNMFNEIASGEYTLISGNLGTGSFALDASLGDRFSYRQEDGKLILIVGADSRLYWSSANGSAQDWNGANWQVGGQGNLVSYGSSQEVVLGAIGLSSADSREMIAVDGAVTAGRVNVSSTYGLEGAGAIAGTTLVVGDGGDMLLGVNANFSEGVQITRGALTVQDAALNANVSLSEQATMNMDGATVTGTVSTKGSGSGNVTLNSAQMSGSFYADSDMATLKADNIELNGGSIRSAANLQAGSIAVAGGSFESTASLQADSVTAAGGSVTLKGTSTIETLAVNGGQSATLYNAAENDGSKKNISTLVLADGATLKIDNRANTTSESGVIGTVQVGGTGTIQEVYGSGHLTIGTLTLAEGTTSGTLNLYKSSSNGGASYTAMFDLGSSMAAAGNFVGDVVLANTATHSGNPKHSVFINLFGQDILANAAVRMNEQKDSGAYLGLGVNVNNARIGGLESSSAVGTRVLLFSGYAPQNIGWNTGDGPDKNVDEVARTLVIDTEAGAAFTYYGQVREMLSIVKDGEGKQAFAGNSGAFNGSIEILEGTLAFSGAALNMLGSASSVAVNGGTLDVSSVDFSNGAIAVNNLTFTDNSVLALGNLQADTVYNIFNNTSGALENWVSLTMDNFSINGTSLSDMGRVTLTLGMDGSFSYTVEDSWDLVWNGGETDTWNDVSSNEVWQTTRPNEMMGTEDTFNTRFTNNDNVLFNSNANLVLEGDIIVNNMSVADNVSLVTNGSLSVAGDLTVGKGISWAFSGDTSLSFTEGELKSANSIVVGDGATLIMTGKETVQDYTSTAMDNVSGAGNVVLHLAKDNGVGFNLNGIEGDIIVAEGRLQVNTSTFNEDATIRLAKSTNLANTNGELVFNGTGTILKNDVVLETSTSFHVNNGRTGTITGVISGDGGLTKAGAGALTLTAQNTYTGATNISGGKIILSTGGNYELYNTISGGTLEIASGTTLVNNGKTVSSALLLQNQSAVTMTGSNTLTSGTVTVADNATASLYAESATINGGMLVVKAGATLNLQGGAYTFKNGNVLSASDAGTINFTAESMSLNGDVTTTFNGRFNVLNDVTFNMNRGNSGDWATTGANIGGTMNIGAGHTLTITGNSRLQINDGATLLLQDGAMVNRTANGAFYIKGSLATAAGAEAELRSVDDVHHNYINASKGLHDTGASVDVAAGSKLTVDVNNFTTYGNAELNVAQDGQLDMSGTNNVNLSSGSSVNLAKGASISLAGMEFSNRGAADNATLDNTSASSQNYGAGNANYTLTNGHAKHTGAGDTTLTNKLDNSSVENAGSGTLTVDNAENSISGVYATGGSMILLSDAELDLKALEIASSLSVSAYSELNEQAEQTKHETRINVSGTATFGNDVTLNADLVMKTGSSLNMAGAVQMGSDVRLETGLTLTGSLYDNVKSMQAGERVTLFTGVDALYLGSSQESITSITLSNGVQANNYFTNLSDSYFLIYDASLDDGQGELSIGMVVPEPTTATLSLVALAALAMRRRRK